MHRIAGFGGALRKGTVADVDRVVARVGDVGGPDRLAGPLLVGRRLGNAASAFAERVLPRPVAGADHAESRPAVSPGGLSGQLGVASGGVDALPVDDDFRSLDVPLPGQQHVRPGPFEHRHEIGKHETLREEIFPSHPLRHPLPAPAVLLLFEVAAVALPEGDVALLETAGRFDGRREPADQRPGAPVGEGADLPPVERASAGERDELLDGSFVRADLQPVLGERLGQQRPHRVVDRLHALLAERVVGESGRHVQPQAPPLDLAALHLGRSAAHLAFDDPGQGLRNAVPLGCVQPLVRRFCVEGEQKEQKRMKEFISHFSFG